MKKIVQLFIFILIVSMSLAYSMEQPCKKEIYDLPAHSMPSSAVVLFSGGLDSSAVTAILAAKGIKNLHLLTFDNGAQDHLDYSKIKINDFIKFFPNTTFKHVISGVQYLFKKLALKDIEEDFKLCDKNMICVGCKMAMHAMAIIYAIKNKISMVADGFAKRQEDFPEQQPCFLEELSKIYALYNINYTSPIYNIASSKEAVKDILFRYGLSTKSIEPGCLFGGTFSKAKSEEIRNFFKRKKSAMIHFINESI